MKIKVETLAGRNYLRQAGMTTRNKMLGSNCRPYTLKQMRKFILQRHGNLNRYIFNVTVEDMPDRIHTHLVRHSIVNDFYTAGTAREDLSFAQKNGLRNVSFYLPLKRALEIYEIRLCGKAWIETYDFFNELKTYLEEAEPALKGLLLPKCAYHGYCVEGGCKFTQIGKYETVKAEVVKYCGGK